MGLELARCFVIKCSLHGTQFLLTDTDPGRLACTKCCLDGIDGQTKVDIKETDVQEYYDYVLRRYQQFQDELAG